MYAPPNYFFFALDSQARQISGNCKDEQLAVFLKNVALGSLTLITSLSSSKVLKDLPGSPDRDRTR